MRRVVARALPRARVGRRAVARRVGRLAAEGAVAVAAIAVGGVAVVALFGRGDDAVAAARRHTRAATGTTCYCRSRAVGDGRARHADVVDARLGAVARHLVVAVGVDGANELAERIARVAAHPVLHAVVAVLAGVEDAVAAGRPRVVAISAGAEIVDAVHLRRATRGENQCQGDRDAHDAAPLNAFNTTKRPLPSTTFAVGKVGRHAAAH